MKAFKNVLAGLEKGTGSRFFKKGCNRSDTKDTGQNIC